MKTWLITLVAVLALGISAPAQAGNPATTAHIPVEKMRDSAVALYQRGEFTCSGVVVKTEPVDLILTAAHCTEADSIQFEQWGKRQGKLVRLNQIMIYVDVIATDYRNDLALLKPRSALPGMLKTVVLRDPNDQLAAGETVYSVSSPAGFQGSLQAGIVSAPRQVDPRVGDEPFVQLNVPGAWFGSSGGGIFDAQGRLISVYSRIVPGSTILIVPTVEALDFFLRTSPQFRVFGENRGGM